MNRPNSINANNINSELLRKMKSCKKFGREISTKCCRKSDMRRKNKKNIQKKCAKKFKIMQKRLSKIIFQNHKGSMLMAVSGRGSRLAAPRKNPKLIEY